MKTRRSSASTFSISRPARLFTFPGFRSATMNPDVPPFRPAGEGEDSECCEDFSVSIIREAADLYFRTSNSSAQHLQHLSLTPSSTAFQSQIVRPISSLAPVFQQHRQFHLSPLLSQHEVDFEPTNVALLAHGGFPQPPQLSQPPLSENRDDLFAMFIFKVSDWHSNVLRVDETFVLCMLNSSWSLFPLFPR